jgi:hypothetical protein
MTSATITTKRPPQTFVDAAIRAAARGQGTAYVRKPVGREHPLDHFRARDAKATLRVIDGVNSDLGVATYGHVAGEHTIEVLGALPARIKRRLRRSLSWREGLNLQARYRWRCAHDDCESFLLRDADELLDLVEERRRWLASRADARATQRGKNKEHA